MTYSLIEKCSYLFKIAAGEYIKDAVNPIKWTKLFLQLGYSGINDPGLGILHKNEPESAVLFGNKFLEVINIIKNPNRKMTQEDYYGQYRNNKDPEFSKQPLKNERFEQYITNTIENIQNLPIDKVNNIIDHLFKFEKDKYTLKITLKNILNKINISNLSEMSLKSIIDLNNDLLNNDIAKHIDNIVVAKYLLKISTNDAIVLFNILKFNKLFLDSQKIELLKYIMNNESFSKELRELSLLWLKEKFQIKTAKNKAEKENYYEKSYLEILKQYVDKPYHYIHYTNTPELIGINPQYSYHTPIGIYGYTFSTARYQKIIDKQGDFGTDRPYIIIFKAKNPSTILDLGSYNEGNLKQDVEKLKQIFTISNLVNNLYNESKEKSLVNHPGSRLFYITMTLSSISLLNSTAQDLIINYSLELMDSTDQNRIEEMISDLIDLRKLHNFNWKPVFKQITQKNIILSSELINKLSKDPEAAKYLNLA